MELIYKEISAERENQISKGYDKKHDDSHDLAELVLHIEHRLEHAVLSEVAGDLVERRKRLVQAAAITVATIESIDRKLTA